jgi:hypothetical protein
LGARLARRAARGRLFKERRVVVAEAEAGQERAGDADRLQLVQRPAVLENLRDLLAEPPVVPVVLLRH